MMFGIGWSRRWTTLRHHPVQYRLWRSTSRFVGVAAGRRSGKTEIAKRRLVLALSQQKPWHNPRYFYGAPTRDQARRIAWQDFLELIPDDWIAGGKLSPNVSHTTLTIRTIYGSELHVVSLDRPQRLEGDPWDGGVLDESSDLRPGTFDRSIRPALSDRGGWAWRIGVPKRQGVGAFEYRRFCEQCLAGEYPNGECFSWPSADILPPEEVSHARETLDAKDFREQYEASWETAGGQIFHAFSREYNVRPCAYQPQQAIVVGSDFNVDPMAWVLGHRFANRLEWFDEVFLRNSNTLETLNVVWQRYQDHRGGWEFYGDASASQRNTAAAASDYVQIANDERFKRAGRTMHYLRDNPPIEDRFSACNALLRNAAGQRRMFVDPHCKNLLADIEQRCYRPGTRQPADLLFRGRQMGHITDAMGYAVYYLFPIKLRLDQPVQVIA
jgi:hypothetical protein